ncbi:hypothetical protein B0H19DRAFT_1254375 [Mycena capillaripes]|nr:hypothetical protein B0H19DRAFT_1254375 [Mycena capillaripes]
MADAAPYVVTELAKSWRMGRCPTCYGFAIGRHNAASHQCDGEIKMLTKSEFPDIERVLYVHDILGNDEMVAFFEEEEDLAAELHLVPISVRQILASEHATKRLQTLLPHPEDLDALRAVFGDVDPKLFVYLPEQRAGDVELQLTLAVDMVLKCHSTCPPDFAPIDPDCRLAWESVQSGILTSWFHERLKPLVLIVCDGPPDYEGLPYFICTDKATPSVAGNSWVLLGRACPPCGRSKANDLRRFHQVQNLLNLPPHHARYLWLQLRRTIERPEKRATKQRKSVRQ